MSIPFGSSGAAPATSAGTGAHRWQVALGIGLVAIGGYACLPSSSAQNWYYSLLTGVSVATIIVGMRLHRPRYALPWVLTLVGAALWALADGAWTVYEEVLHATLPSPSAVDVVYLVGYIPLVLSLVLLRRRRAVQREWGSLIDATIVSVSLGVLSWVYLMAPYATDPALTLLERLVAIAYPLMDVLLLVVAVHLLLTPGGRSPTYALLALGYGLTLLADAGYGYMLLHGGYTTGSLPAYGWMLAYLLWGVAALHPSMRTLGDPVPVLPGKLTWRRMALLAGASLLAPTILAVEAGRGAAIDVPALVGGSVVLFLLSLLRIGTLAQALRAALTQLQVAQERMAHQAFHDTLTNLPNRALFMDRVQQALARAARAETTLAVLFLDLDGFKQVNDTLGHDAGDTVLVEVAQRLQACLRPEDTAARLGGDEFTIVLETIVTDAAAVEVAQRILAELRRPLMIQNRRVEVGGSIGIAVSVAGRDLAEDVLCAADVAMYRAKHDGKGRYAVFDPRLDAPALARLDHVAELRRALEQGEFELHYQPTVRLTTGTVVGMEALVRWRHPERGLLLPGGFIALAEATGLIVPLGRWVLAQACQQARVWQRELPAGMPLVVSVNVSPQQLHDPHFVDDVGHILAQTGLDAHVLALELTERSLMQEAEGTRAMCTHLRARGVQLWLDDFGIGYASLSYLKQFPFDQLKIDKVFVAGAGQDATDTAIIAAMVALARALGMRVVAEGIETATQLAQLRALGCEQGQGSYFAPALPAAAARALLAPPHPTDTGQWMPSPHHGWPAPPLPG